MEHPDHGRTWEAVVWRCVEAIVQSSPLTSLLLAHLDFVGAYEREDEKERELTEGQSQLLRELGYVESRATSKAAQSAHL